MTGCSEWQDLTTKLLWLNFAQIVLFAVVGFLGLYWRGRMLNAHRDIKMLRLLVDRLESHRKWPTVRHKSELTISTDVEKL